jgi:hypothetical protein
LLRLLVDSVGSGPCPLWMLRAQPPFGPHVHRRTLARLDTMAGWVPPHSPCASDARLPRSPGVRPPTAHTARDRATLVSDRLIPACRSHAVLPRLKAHLCAHGSATRSSTELPGHPGAHGRCALESGLPIVGCLSGGLAGLLQCEVRARANPPVRQGTCPHPMPTASDRPHKGGGRCRVLVSLETRQSLPCQNVMVIPRFRFTSTCEGHV